MEKKYAIFMEEGNRLPRIIEFGGDMNNLQYFYSLLECDYIEAVRTVLPGKYIVIDEEGKLKENTGFNVFASLLYGFLEHGQTIAGKALLCGMKYTDEGRDFDGLTYDEAKEILRKFGIESEYKSTR